MVTWWPPLEQDPEPALVAGGDALDGAGDDPAAVAADLVAAAGQQLGGRHPVAGEEPLHVRRGGVAGVSGVQDQDLAAGAGQDQCG